MAEMKNPKTEGFEDVFELFDTPETDEEEIGSRWMMIKGREYKLEARNPYGHFHIIPRKGTLPEELRGSYTSSQEAERHITQVYNILEDKAEKAALRKEVDPVVKEKMAQKRVNRAKEVAVV